MLCSPIGSNTASETGERREDRQEMWREPSCAGLFLFVVKIYDFATTNKPRGSTAPVGLYMVVLYFVFREIPNTKYVSELST